MRRLSLSAAIAVSLFAAGHAAAATFYVSASGSDANPGTSQSAAWRTVGKVNAAALAPGDTVLFEGGQTFSDTTLMPSRSGSAGAPITFASYGAGRATIANANGAVWFSGKGYLTFDRLSLSSAGAAAGVFAGSPGGASDHIVLSDSSVSGSSGVGVNSPNSGDSAWTISGNTFTNLGDSGLILQGSDESVTGNTISNVGINAAITYGKHGIYAKGPNMTIARNDISGVSGGQAVSIRFHGARVYENTVHDTAYAFAFFDYDTAPSPQGTSYIYSNRLWNISGYGFYYDGQADPNGHAPTVDFVLASNTFTFSGAQEAVNVAPSGSARVTIFNNIFTGSFGSALRSAATTVERNDDWASAAANVPANTGNMTVTPVIGSAPAFTLTSSSPLVDRGTMLPLLAYNPNCDGSALSYCGAFPDIGASESNAVVVPAPVPVPVPSPPGQLTGPGGLAALNVGTSTLSLTWTPSADSRTTGYQVMENGAQIATPTASSMLVSSLACGTSYRFSVAAVDAAGDLSPDASLTVSTAACPDTTAPTLSLTTPSANVTVPLVLTVAAAASDASGILKVDFSVDGRLRCSDSVASYTCTVSLSKGWHSLTATATDRAGNKSVVTEWIYASAAKRSRLLQAVKAKARQDRRVVHRRR
jgi:Bacterial Ig domain/Right handed beta helix region/Fibronectin type III domain